MALSSLADQFDNWLGGINYPKDSFAGQLYPFWHRVGIVQKAPPRHERFEFMIDMGLPDIERVFTGEPLSSEHLTFVFPERYMSVHEQQAFMAVLNKHPDAVSGRIKTMDMLTSCSLLISSFHKEAILILNWPDDDEYAGRCK